MDVYTTVNVPFSTAVLGGEAKVHTLYGDVICKVREGTQSGSKIRLRGKGYCFHEEPAGTRRSLCDRPGTGAAEHYSGSQTQTA